MTGTTFNPDQGSVVDLGRLTPNLEVSAPTHAQTSLQMQALGCRVPGWSA